MRTQTDIGKTIARFVANYFLKQPDSELDPDTSFLEKGIIDSTGVMELVAFLEETFGFRVEDDEIVPANFDSIRRLADYVRSKLDGRSGDSFPNPGN
jgi:acyl carrier protein